jgi:enoyl-[acyl-carrier protein] reductase II
MKKTRVSDLLGINYPILQGGMFWLATAELAAAVSNAGALGIISPHAGMERDGDPADNLRRQMGRAKELTEKPWAVNLLLDLDVTGILTNVMLQEGVRIVVTAAGSPRLYTDLFHAEGIKVLHVVSSVKQARIAESCHVDAVIAGGVESAARLGYDELPLFSLIPQVADAVFIPVIASGGIVDARGVVAALALGAEGVQLGTRFVAVDENIAHPAYKQAIVEAQDNDTVITARKIMPTRSLKTEFSRRLLELEAAGASAEALREFLGRSRARKGQIEGDLFDGEFYCGTSSGLIKEILPVTKVVQRLVQGHGEIIKKVF